jgi:hypothetical protein
MTPYTPPPGAPEPQEDTTRSYFEWVEGTGPSDPKDPNSPKVAGTWKVDRYAGTEEFTPGQGISSRAAGRGGSGHDPANVATAKWLIDKGIAKTPEEAWTMVNTGKSNPQTMATQVYNAALRSTFGNVEKAKSIVAEWQKLNATQAPASPQARPTAPAAHRHRRPLRPLHRRGPRACHPTRAIARAARCGSPVMAAPSTRTATPSRAKASVNGVHTTG